MESEHQQYGMRFGVSQLRMRKWKTYIRNGKTFLRNYNREVKDGLNALDLQRMANAQMIRALIANLGTNVYSTIN